MFGVNFIGDKLKLFFPNEHKFDSLTDRLHWGFFCGEEDDATIYLKSNGFLRCMSYTCPDLSIVSEDETQRIAHYCNNAIKQLGSSNWCIHIESRRELTNDYPCDHWPNKLSYLVDSRRKENFKRTKHFKNRYFISFTYHLSDDIYAKTENLLYSNKEEKNEFFSKSEFLKNLTFFHNKIDEILSYLSMNIKVIPLSRDETVTYLHSTCSTSFGKRRAPKDDMMFDAFITDEDVNRYKTIKVGDNYVIIISIKDFPNDTESDMFQALNSAQCEYRWVSRWIGIDPQNARKLLDKSTSQWMGNRKSGKTLLYEAVTNHETGNTDPSAEVFLNDVGDTRIELAEGTSSIGYYTGNIMVWDEDYDVAYENAKYIRKIINACEFSAKIETLNTFPAWLGMMPGNAYDNVRKYLLTSSNTSDIFPLSSVWEGMRVNGWTGEFVGSACPLLTCETPQGTPFFLNLNVGDVFHSFIFGPTGAGKSTFLCNLEVAFMRYKDAHVIVIDKDKTARGVIVGAGGSYVEPGTNGVAFQPLRNIDDEKDFMWSIEFIAQCLVQQHMFVTSQQREAIRIAMQQLRDTKDPDSRSITTFQQYCLDEDVRAGIQPYTLLGTYGSIFDADHTSIADSKYVMIEMGTLMQMGEAAITPALMFLFHYIESHFAEPNDAHGHMTLLVLDEAWTFLDNDYFASTIKDWLKTLRKRHVAVVFATQNVTDAANSKIADTIISQCFTKFYLADNNASNDYIAEGYRKFGLEEWEIKALSEARMKRDYLYKSSLGSRFFQLGLDKFQLAALCPDAAVIDEVEEEYGMNSGKQLADVILEKQGFDCSRYLKKGA